MKRYYLRAGWPLGRWYTYVAMQAWNLLFLLILLNTVLLAVYTVWDERTYDRIPGPYLQLRERVGPDWASLVYPGWDERTVRQLYAEWFRLTYTYDSATQYRVQPTRGDYYNVTPEGFRLNGPDAPWPPDPQALNILVFGGSTTFGTGLPDYQTIPAALETLLHEQGCPATMRVYNFGVPGHTSFEERARFEQLLARDTAPQVAVFVDGLNDAFGRAGSPIYTAQLARMMAAANATDAVERVQLRARQFVSTLPMVRLARSVQVRLGRARPGDDQARPNALGVDIESDEILPRWLSNKRAEEALGDEFGVKTLFVWQPTPMYNYDPADHLIAGEVPPWQGNWNLNDKLTLYQRMSERRHDPEVSQNLLWLADIQPDRKENLYVDQVHYTAAFSRDIASLIAADLRGRNWVACVPSAAN
jgi:lysophospholipase L1-like esterase